jgi:predicted TIM-barrel fold metal-dependent hydrolase
VRTAGKKALFGSNHPAWPAKQCLEGFETLDLDPEAADLFLHGNSERVFRL